MRVSSTCLLLLPLLSAACATSPQAEALTARRDAIRQTSEEKRIEFEKNYRGHEGFQSALWGMSPEEVKALYPGAQPASAITLVTNAEIVDRPATVYFFFTDHRLAFVSVEFSQPNDVRAEFSNLSSLLSTKYGAPSADSTAPNPLGSSREAQRHEDLSTEWTTPESRVELIGHRSMDQKVLDLHYESRILGARVHQDMEKETTRHRGQQLKEL